MAISRRYQPTHPAGQSRVYGLDMSAVLPPGIGVTQPGVTFQTNTTPPGIATGISSSGGGFGARRLWVTITGGVAGTDYIVTWSFQDTQGNAWVRSILLLCAPTS